MRRERHMTGWSVDYRTMSIPRIDPGAYAAALARLFARLGWLWLDALPPYRKIEGRLDAKESSADGRHFLLVDSQMVEVDWFTYETLMEGEALRVRATRSYRAINIDRIVP